MYFDENIRLWMTKMNKNVFRGCWQQWCSGPRLANTPIGDQSPRPSLPWTVAFNICNTVVVVHINRSNNAGFHDSLLSTAFVRQHRKWRMQIISPTLLNECQLEKNTKGLQASILEGCVLMCFSPQFEMFSYPFRACLLELTRELRAISILF